jgi:hypothetical protein
MPEEVEDLRKGDRFVPAEPLTGSFNGTEVTFANVSLAGAQILHSEPLRIGQRARLDFRGIDTAASLHARVTWSRLSQDDGVFLYRSGLAVESADPQYARALNELIRNGTVVLDRDSLERKVQRAREREEQRRTTGQAIPTQDK